MAVPAQPLTEPALQDEIRSKKPEALPPDIGAHRLLSNGRSAALVRPQGEIDWWCAPHYDDRPLLWSLLDPAGSVARWEGVRLVALTGRPAGPIARTQLKAEGGTIESLDGLVTLADDVVALVRAVRSPSGTPVVLRHSLSLGGFDSDFAEWQGPVAIVDGRQVTVFGAATERTEGRTLHSTVPAERGWSGLVITVGGAPDADIEQLVAELEVAEEAAASRLRRAKLPKNHPERATDALAVLRACTFEPTGAVIAAATTSLPEAPGGDRQFDYRFCWLRDAALAVSVASLLGEREAADRYLRFVNREAAGGAPTNPLFSISGGQVPEEREVPGVAGWAGSLPVRVGNAAASQVQYDALGLVVEAVSVHLQTGGSLDADTWSTVVAIADEAAAAPVKPSHGIWEFREERQLVSADIGRWLALDRAIWIARGWRPWVRRRRWKRARAELRTRVLAALGDEWLLPQTYDGPYIADASALMVPLFGMLGRRDPRASKLIDATLRELGSGPYVYRYEPDESDGFSGREGCFVPVCWWAVAALAAVGRVEEARGRLDELCRRLPPLLAEEVDPADDRSLGNVPLVWSHVELARALYVLDAAERRQRWGAAGLWAWRLGRYAVLRFGRGGSKENS